MSVEIKTIEKNLEGMCPACQEWTLAGDSCCSRGAVVEGGLVTDEEAEIEANEPARIVVKLLSEISLEKAQAVKAALWAAGLQASVSAPAGTNLFSVHVQVGIDQLPGLVKTAEAA